MQEFGKGKSSPAQALEVRLYECGDPILCEGQDSPFFYVILSGQVRLSHEGKKIRVLGEQDIFGLENLVLKRPSYYAALAVTPSRIARYGPGALDFLIRESPRMVRNLLISTMHQLTQTTNVLLAPQDTSLGDQLLMHFFNDGELIFEETPDGVFYRLVSTQGLLQVTIGGQEVCRINKPGDFLCLPDFPRKAAVKCIGDCVLERYDCDNLELLIRNYPDAATLIMRDMMERLYGSKSQPAP